MARRRIRELHQCILCLCWRPPSRLYRIDDLWLCSEPTHRGQRAA